MVSALNDLLIYERRCLDYYGLFVKNKSRFLCIHQNLDERLLVFNVSGIMYYDAAVCQRNIKAPSLILLQTELHLGREDKGITSI